MKYNLKEKTKKTKVFGKKGWGELIMIQYKRHNHITSTKYYICVGSRTLGKQVPKCLYIKCNSKKIALLRLDKELN